MTKSKKAPKRVRDNVALYLEYYEELGRLSHPRLSEYGTSTPVFTMGAVGCTAQHDAAAALTAAHIQSEACHE